MKKLVAEAYLRAPKIKQDTHFLGRFALWAPDSPTGEKYFENPTEDLQSALLKQHIHFGSGSNSVRQGQANFGLHHCEVWGLMTSNPLGPQWPASVQQTSAY